MTLVVGLPISGREASIGEQVCAGDIAGFGTGEIRYEAGDLVCITIALKGCDATKRPGEVAVGGIRVGINRAGLDVVNGDAARAEVSRKALRKTCDRSLRKRIDRTTEEGHAFAVGAADVNNAAALIHMPRGF